MYKTEKQGDEPCAETQKEKNQIEKMDPIVGQSQFYLICFVPFKC